MDSYTATIIDDELIDIISLKKIVSNYCINISLIGESQTIDEGIVTVSTNKPNIVFLDVMFKESIIFDYLDQFDFEDVQVIFITSEKNYALNAFKSNAVDFILKPFSVESVISAVNKAVKRINSNGCCGAKNCLNKRNNFPVVNIPMINIPGSNYIAIPSLDKTDFIRTSEILFCMAEGKYTTFFLSSGKKIVSSKNLGEFEKLLDHSYFFRIHHAYIINIRHLVSIIKKDGAYCELSNRVTIPIAKRRQDEFNKFIKLKN